MFALITHSHVCSYGWLVQSHVEEKDVKYHSSLPDSQRERMRREIIYVFWRGKRMRGVLSEIVLQKGKDYVPYPRHEYQGIACPL